MPNFHTHWLVALQAMEGFSKQYAFLRDGKTTYQRKARELGKEVRDHVRGVLERTDLDGARALQDTIASKVAAWEDKLRGDEDAICFSAYCLGACGPDFWMLPCDTTTGKPDLAAHHFDLGHYNRTHRQFEVSLKALKGKDDFQARVEKSYFLGMATHFGADLVLHELVNVSAGAYNLLKMDKVPPHGTWSNEQGIEYLSPGTPAPPQPEPTGNLAQRAWGNHANARMAVLHHVVDGGGKAVAGTVPIWTTHNKVEHYWDTWVRYRWLGDFGKVWGDDVEASSFPVLGLPLCDTLRRDLLGRSDTVAGMPNTIGHYVKDGWRAVGRAVPGVDHSENRRAAVVDRVDYVLGSVETRWLLEKPLAFPWLFADAVLDGNCEPFIYKRVVDKDAGAYRKELVFDRAFQEAIHAQMDEPAPPKVSVTSEKIAPPPSAGGRSEKKKLQFFSTERNHTIPVTSWNYLNYISCPNHDRLVKYGKDKFYDRKAFPPFTSASISAAKTFATGLANAYAEGRIRAGRLGQFWNLDTGLGLRIQTVKSPERHHVVTRLDWIHVLGPPGANQKVAYRRILRPPYTAGMAAAVEPYPLAGWKDSDRAFNVYPSPQFDALKAIVEDGSVVDARRYLDRIRPKHALAAKPTAPIFKRLRDKKVQDDDDEFDKALFVNDDLAPQAPKHPLPTGKALKAAICPVEHRLDLVVRASIARLGAKPGKVAMVLLSDKESKPGEVAIAENDDREEDSATGWLRNRSKILDRVVKPEPNPDLDKVGLATFSARIVLNLSDDRTKAKARVVTPAGKWNNVIPWQVHREHYGRNFAVATARTHTLRGKNRKPPYDFDPTNDYLDLQGLGLTEHCFFTIYPLVKIGQDWWDAFSRQKVTATDFKTMKKIEAINFVKIVLLYVLDGDGALNLGWCYLDGMRHQVKEVDR